MLNKPISAVTSFHKAYGLGVEDKPTVAYLTLSQP